MYEVSVKTSAHVKVKRSWIYENVIADSAIAAGMKATNSACEWWGLKERDITVVYVKLTEQTTPEF